MSLERKYPAIASQSFTANGTIQGVIEIADACIFRVHQEVIVEATAQDSVTLIVYEVTNATTLIVGTKVAYHKKSPFDLTAYTTAASASIKANKQTITPIDPKEIEHQTFERSPVSGRRNVLVDKCGNIIDTDNPLAVQLTDGSVNIGTVNAELEVQLSHQNDVPDSGDIADSVRIGDGTLTATITNIASDNGLDVNVIGTVSSGGMAEYDEDSPHSSEDTGIAILGVHRASDDTGVEVDADGDYAMPHIDVRGRMRVSPGALKILDVFTSTSGWTVLNDDTANLTTSTDHITAVNSLTFDKVDGTANTTLAMIQKTLSTPVDIFAMVTGAIFIQAFVKVSDYSEVLNVIIRLGTDDSNYNEWKISTEGTQVNMWKTFRKLIGNTEGSTGAGWDITAISYIAIGLEFESEDNTLAGIKVDAIILNAGQLGVSDITSEVSDDPLDINLTKVGSKKTDIGAGNAGTGTQRVSISTDDVNLAAINAGQLADGHDVHLVHDNLQDIYTPTLATSTLFAVGDFLHKIEVTDAMSRDNGSCRLKNITVINKNGGTATFSLRFMFYDTDPTIASASGAKFSITDAEQEKFIDKAIVRSGSFVEATSNTVGGSKSRVDLINKSSTGGEERSFWVAVIVVADFTTGVADQFQYKFTTVAT